MILFYDRGKNFLQLLLLSFLLWITPPRYIKEIPKNKEWANHRKRFTSDTLDT
jgi:hypothetical protein